MIIEEKQFDLSIRGISTISEILKDVDAEIMLNGYGAGWYLKSLTRMASGIYQVVVQRQVSDDPNAL